MSDSWEIEIIDWEFCLGKSMTSKRPYYYRGDARIIYHYNFDKVTMVDFGVLNFLKCYQTLHFPFQGTFLAEKRTMVCQTGIRLSRLGQTLGRLMASGLLRYQDVTTNIPTEFSILDQNRSKKSKEEEIEEWKRSPQYRSLVDPLSCTAPEEGCVLSLGGSEERRLQQLAILRMEESCST